MCNYGPCKPGGANSSVEYVRPGTNPLPQTHPKGEQVTHVCGTCGTELHFWTFSDQPYEITHLGRHKHRVRFGGRGLT